MQVDVTIKAPTLPKYLNASVMGSDRRIHVSELDEQTAAQLWDQWKADWLKHVKDATKPEPEEPKTPKLETKKAANG